jgi:hypothetical protein
LTAEISLRSLEDEAFCQRFIDTHNPPERGQSEVS